MRQSVTLTVAAGTVQPVLPYGVGNEYAFDLIFTPLVGAGTALIYVLNFDPAAAAAAAPTKNAQNFVAEIGPASATVPGTPFRLDRSMQGQRAILLNEWGIDGSHTGDTVQVSWEPAL